MHGRWYMQWCELWYNMVCPVHTCINVAHFTLLTTNHTLSCIQQSIWSYRNHHTDTFIVYTEAFDHTDTNDSCYKSSLGWRQTATAGKQFGEHVPRICYILHNLLHVVPHICCTSLYHPVPYLLCRILYTWTMRNSVLFGVMICMCQNTFIQAYTVQCVGGCDDICRREE